MRQKATQTPPASDQTHKNKDMNKITLLALIGAAAVGITACDQKPNVETISKEAATKAGEAAKGATDAAAGAATDAAKKAGVPGAEDKIKDAADTTKKKIDDVTGAKPKPADPTTDEVINAPPDAAPAPKPAVPPAAPAAPAAPVPAPAQPAGN